MSQAPQLNEGIKVFYSYSHKDEKLRNELAKHLSILRRQGVISDWHDRKITAGSEWGREIDQHLSTAQIILLLISPDFLASDYCYDIEMKRAMERHDAGEARVIPVILRPVDWKGAPFSKLQALPKDAKAVVLWRSWDEAFVNIAQGIREAVEDLKRRSGLHIAHAPQQMLKVTTRTLIVDQRNRGDHVTIMEAIRAANQGDRILVRPGLYHESLVIDKSLEIIGDGKCEEIIIQTRENPVLLFKAMTGRVSNLTLRQIGGNGKLDGVTIVQGRLDLEDCDISSQNSVCVSIYDGGCPRLRRNRIHDSNKAGVCISGNSWGMLEENEIYNNVGCGVIIMDSNLIARHNRINKNGHGAVLILSSGAGTFEDNDLRNNNGGAWKIFGDSLPYVKRARNIEE